MLGLFYLMADWDLEGGFAYSRGMASGKWIDGCLEFEIWRFCSTCLESIDRKAFSSSANYASLYHDPSHICRLFVSTATIGTRRLHLHTLSILTPIRRPQTIPHPPPNTHPTTHPPPPPTTTHLPSPTPLHLYLRSVRIARKQLRELRQREPAPDVQRPEIADGGC